MELKGRSAIITGANQGLGQAIATSFVQAGASVLLVARGEERLRAVQGDLAHLATQPGQQVHAVRGDVSDPASCAAVMTRAQELLPDTTILVNNAGVYGPMGPVEEVAWDAWVEAIQINL